MSETTITPEEIARLRELANAATPGSENWDENVMCHGNYLAACGPWHVASDGQQLAQSVADGLYIAAAHPGTVLRLLDALDAAEAKADVIGGAWCAKNRAEGRGPCGSCAICCRDERQRAESAERDRDAVLEREIETADEQSAQRTALVKRAEVAERDAAEWETRWDAHCKLRHKSTDELARRVEAAEARVVALEKDWDRLLEQIAVQVGDEEDHDAADATDPEFTGQFDPWDCLRRAGAAFEHLGARLKAKVEKADALRLLLITEQQCDDHRCIHDPLLDCIDGARVYGFQCSTVQARLRAALRVYEEVP